MNQNEQTARNLADFPVGTRVVRIQDHAFDRRRSAGHVVGALGTVVASGFCLRVALDNGDEGNANYDSLKRTATWVRRTRANQTWLKGQHALVCGKYDPAENAVRVRIPGESHDTIWSVGAVELSSVTGPLNSPVSHEWALGKWHRRPVIVLQRRVPRVETRAAGSMTMAALADAWRVETVQGRVSGLSRHGNLPSEEFQVKLVVVDSKEADALSAYKRAKSAERDAEKALHAAEEALHAARDVVCTARGDSQKAWEALNRALAF